MIVALVSIAFSQVSDPVDALLRSKGFLPERVSYSNSQHDSWRSTYGNKARRGSVRFSVSKSSEVSAGQSVRRIDDSLGRSLDFERRASNGTTGNGLASNLPLGIQLRAFRGNGSSQVNAFSDMVSVRVDIGFGGRMTSGVTRFETADPPHDQLLIEGVARWVLATETAKYLVRTPTSVAGRSYGGFKHPQGQMQIPAREWAQNSGYSMQVNDEAGRAYLSGPGGSILIPLGSDKVKVNGNWLVIDGVVAADKSEPLLPVSAIQALLGN